MKKLFSPVIGIVIGISIIVNVTNPLVMMAGVLITIGSIIYGVLNLIVVSPK